MSDFLFVYGTLARGAGHEMHRYLVRHAEFVGEGHINGRLYQIADYPGAVTSGNLQDKVFGELYRLTDAAAVFAGLDDYEGADFVRRQLPVRLENGQRQLAWIYLYIGSVASLPRIASGRFKAGTWR